MQLGTRNPSNIRPSNNLTRVWTAWRCVWWCLLGGLRCLALGCKCSLCGLVCLWLAVSARADPCRRVWTAWRCVWWCLLGGLRCLALDLFNPWDGDHTWAFACADDFSHGGADGHELYQAVDHLARRDKPPSKEWIVWRQRPDRRQHVGALPVPTIRWLEHE
jgi:hypothetical protein